MRWNSKVLLALSLLGHLVAAAAPHATAVNERTVEKSGLEGPDDKFATMDLVSYARYLVTPDAAASGIATEGAMLGMLKRGADDLALLYPTVYDSRERFLSIFFSLQAVLRHHSGHWSRREGPALSPAGLATIVEQRFDTYAPLTHLALWQGFCMAGLLGETLLRRAVSWLSTEFRDKNLHHLIFASIMLGDMDTFHMLVESSHRLVQQHWESIVVSVAIKGSVSLLRSVRQYLPTTATGLTALASCASRVHQEAVFAETIQMIRATDDKETRERALWDAFTEACSTGVVGMVKLFLTDHSDIIPAEVFTKGLAGAAKQSNLPMIKYFAQREGPQSLCNRRVLKATVLSAIRHDRIQVLEFLLLEWGSDHRAELRPIIPAALDRAIRRASFDAVKLLLGRDNHDNLWIPTLINDEHATSLLHDAIRKRRMDIIALVLDQDDPRFAHFDVAAHHNAAFRLACEVGNVEAVRFLLRVNADQTRAFPDVDPGALSNAGLVSACENGHLDVVKVLLSLDENGALVYQTVDPGARRNQPLMEATYHGHLAIVEFLLQTQSTRDGTYYVFQNVDPTLWYRSALCVVATRKHVNMIEFLLQKDEDGDLVHAEVYIPDELLSVAVSGGSVEVVRALLQRHQFTREQLVRARTVAEKEQRHEVLILLGTALQPSSTGGMLMAQQADGCDPSPAERQGEMGSVH